MSLRKVKGILFLIILWQGLSLKADTLIVPSPSEVALVFKNEILTIAGILEVVTTIVRFAIAYSFSVVAAVLLGIVLFRNKLVGDFLWPLLTVLQATPVISWVLLALLWFPSNIIPYFVLGVFILPIVAINTLQGLKSTDQKLLEMAKVYGIDEKKVFSKIMIPSMLPSLMSAVKVTANSSLKILVTSEIIGRLPRGMGNRMNIAWINIETSSLLAWTIFLIVLTTLLEKIVSRTIGVYWGRYL